MGTKRPKSAALIYFHAQVYWKIKVFVWRTKMGTKRPKSAAPIYFHADVYEREFSSPFLLISLLRLRGSLRLPPALRAWKIETQSLDPFVLTETKENLWLPKWTFVKCQMLYFLTARWNLAGPRIHFVILITLVRKRFLILTQVRKRFILEFLSQKVETFPHQSRFFVQSIPFSIAIEVAIQYLRCIEISFGQNVDMYVKPTTYNVGLGID